MENQRKENVKYNKDTKLKSGTQIKKIENVRYAS